MAEEDVSGTGLRAFAAALVLAGLLLPAAVVMLLSVSGLWAPGFLAALRGSWWWLAAGLLSGGFGLCSAPLGLPLVLKILSVPQNAARAVSGGFVAALAWASALLTLSVYSWLAMPVPYSSVEGDAGLWATFGVLVLAAGTGVRLLLEFGRFRRGLVLGEVSLDSDEVPCAPGGRAAVSLRTGKKALSVSAELKLFNADAEELASRVAEVSGPSATEGGWAYRISWAVPADIKVPEGGAWELEVEARGRGGAVARESVSVRLRG